MKKRTLLLGGAGLVAMGAVGVIAWRESSLRAPQANRAASQAAFVPTPPDVEAFFAARLPDVQGHDTPLDAFRGEPLLINFWATWCPPCVAEMPDLEALSKSFNNVQFVGIAIDTDANVKKFLQKIPVSYPILVAGHSGIDLVRAMGNSTGGLPYTVLISPDGRVHDQILGQVKPEALRQQLVQLLAGSRR